MLSAPAVACLATLAATPIVIVSMHRLAAIDEVNARSSHHAPTPRGGGVAVALGLFAGVLTTVLARGSGDVPDLLPLSAATALFGLIGLAEDVGGVTAMRRLALHTAASFAVAAMTVLGAVLGDPAPGLPMVLLVCVAAPVWITGYVNAFNFMDGINGISALTAVLSGATLAALGAARDAPTVSAGGVIVAAAALGFLPFNFPRARVFLGDVGSYTLGAVLAVLTAQTVLAGVPPEAALAPSALYLADTTVTLIRRIRAGERWHTAHRSHVYQRLTIAGWSHPKVTGLVGVTTLAVVVLSLAAFGPLPVRLLGDGAALAVLAVYLTVPRRAARRAATGAEPTPARLPQQRRAPAAPAMAPAEPPTPTSTSTPTSTPTPTSSAGTMTGGPLRGDAR